MKIYKLKKKNFFSLISILLCCALLYCSNSIFNITGLVSNKVELLKEKEMKYMFGEIGILSDNYSYENTAGYIADNIIKSQQDAIKISEKDASSFNGGYQDYLPQKSKKTGSIKSMSEYVEQYKKYQNISNQLKKQVEEDSYRHKYFDFYYIFNYEYTMNALKKLDNVIEKTAKAQKMPKALLASVLFREMMFLGQEDILDGVKFIGGKSMGICQIGVENVRYNEYTVHGKDSIVANKTDDEIIEMLQNPNQAVYFCAVQLRARAITLTGNKQIDLHNLDVEQIHKVLEEYNQSRIPKTIGPVKTKERYAQETYQYYKIISELYKCEANR
ncbi:hypothetical protein EHE19_010350 [Ruminiclostridium herbifermentans]|uniref:Mannosyl-glycoprotein endo-beta-N-acetylglucosamidase-like domain-containing protein n=1 Tax=Ruminiclostridium herbifermentans TaxID=2488810 RepID=A0A4U7JIH2_9FIRM|nr:hypothetical protein [Ruminiclostridium herbifermentans]QNU65341.1 hypothetical protein EHE19_010350 [Ruminiclostridium herbifermentans]